MIISFEVPCFEGFLGISISSNSFSKRTWFTFVGDVFSDDLSDTDLMEFDGMDSSGGEVFLVYSESILIYIILFNLSLLGLRLWLWLGARVGVTQGWGKVRGRVRVKVRGS